MKAGQSSDTKKHKCSVELGRPAVYEHLNLQLGLFAMQKLDRQENYGYGDF
jgi:hypothetical protein